MCGEDRQDVQESTPNLARFARFARFASRGFDARTVPGKRSSTQGIRSSSKAKPEPATPERANMQK